MIRLGLLVAIGTTLCLFSSGISVAANQQDSGKPNIILVMADDQGWGDAGYNGHPFVQTPALDAMAKNGFVFERFYAGAPVCSPTRASVMTGRNPIRAKVPNHGRYMRPHEQTIGETLRAAGYDTGIFGKVHLGSGQPDSPCNPSGMGFDEFPQFPEDTTKGHAAWNDWPWKLHRINGKTFELYNLMEDPMETTDLSEDPKHKQQFERMKKELDAWMRSVVRSLNGKDYRQD